MIHISTYYAQHTAPACPPARAPARPPRGTVIRETETPGWDSTPPVYK